MLSSVPPSAITMLLVIFISIARLSADDVTKRDVGVGATSAELSPTISKAAGDASASDVGIVAPEGFDVTLYADDQLAHDIYSLTIDRLGRVVVSGPGYVRILIDRDNDGVADSATEFASLPASGAQGMYFRGSDLLCIGDGGLLLFRDKNQDDVADGRPERFLKLKTGGEHDAHSLQLGPDGWWYLIAGNTSEITAAYSTLPSAPIRYPDAGVLMRLTPNLQGAEVIADGMRNAYDFAFTPAGTVVTFDSDDERDISLPWYRPTRVFELPLGASAGWISKSWKKPDSFLDMPPVRASLGRGSPTGVVVYRHTLFPQPYVNAVFALDWTYGRVWALKSAQAPDNNATNSSPIAGSFNPQPELFLSASGEHGFAPTDAEVGPDGSLYVSVGGRGTRGGVYRVKPIGAKPTPLAPATDVSECLASPQPYTSWSRKRWQADAIRLGRDVFAAAVLREELPEASRVRAIETITELFGGPTNDEVRSWAKSVAAPVRARAVWSIGRGQSPQKPLTPTSGPAIDLSLYATFLSDDSPEVAQAALESLQLVAGTESLEPLAKDILALGGHRVKTIRWLSVVCATHLKPLTLIAAMNNKATPKPATTAHAQVTAALALVLKQPTAGERITCPAFVTLRTLLETLREHPPAMAADVLRAVQLMLGDLGPSLGKPGAFDGYASPADLESHERRLDELRIAAAGVYPLGPAETHQELDRELGRIIAMLAPASATVLTKVLEPISQASHPVDDLHQLCIAARIPVSRNSPQRDAIANALVGIEPKLRSRGLPQDLSWNDRFKEIYQALVRHDEFLPLAILATPGFGQPSHVLFMSEVPGDQLQPAIDSFAKAIAAFTNYPWNNDVVFLLGESTRPEHRQLLLTQLDRFATRGAVLSVLAAKPQELDRSLFRDALAWAQTDVLSACLGAFDRLASLKPEDAAALVRLFSRLGTDKREYEQREQVAKLLSRATGQLFGFIEGAKGHTKQSEVAARWQAWLGKTYPQLVATSSAESDWSTFTKLMDQVDWKAGDTDRGKLVYEKRACAQCHGGRSGLGPDLAGITSRFSREDLYRAIIEPSRDISARYQTTLIETKAGKNFAGLIVYESADGLLLRNALQQTFRIESADIEDRRPSNVSLMPVGLLKDCTANEVADLTAYLGSLGGKSAGTAPVTASGGLPAGDASRGDESPN